MIFDKEKCHVLPLYKLYHLLQGWTQDISVMKFSNVRNLLTTRLGDYIISMNIKNKKIKNNFSFFMYDYK